MDMVQTFKIVIGIDKDNTTIIGLLRQWTGVPEVRPYLTTWSSLDVNTSTEDIVSARE
jgi:hypothetical protein